MMSCSKHPEGVYHYILSSGCLFHNVCASKIGQIMIYPLHHMRHTWQCNTMQRKNVTKTGPVSLIALEG